MTHASTITTVIEPRARDLGDGFTVQRVLPHQAQRAVGPFVFLDQIGPTVFMPGQGLDVRPHPHIGLATVTYLFRGSIFHRDSLGNARAIEPGAVNWMTAGRGIVHSERSTPQDRGSSRRLFGIQSWVALPKHKEETAPSFLHCPEEHLPFIDDGQVQIRVIAGHFRGVQSPVETFQDTLYADVLLEENARVHVPHAHEERAAYICEGLITHGGRRFEPGRLIVFAPGHEIWLEAETPARLLLLGGEALDGPRHLWWNFVSSSLERIETAKADWKAGRFPPVPDETDFIPLPE